MIEQVDFKVQDTLNPLWLKLKPHLEQRLAYLRTQNDGDADATKTANLRGRIAEVKAMLQLDKEYVARLDGKS